MDATVEVFLSSRDEIALIDAFFALCPGVVGATQLDSFMRFEVRVE